MLQPKDRLKVEASLIKKCWENEQFKARVKADATAMYKDELAALAPQASLGSCEVRVLEESDAKFYLVLPAQLEARELPALTERSTRVDFEASLVQRAHRDAAFKVALLKDPKAAYEMQLGVIKQGAKLPVGTAVQAFEETGSVLYLRIPQRPASTTGVELSEAELQQVAGGVGAVGVAIVSYVVVGAVAGAVIVVAEEQA